MFGNPVLDLAFAPWAANVLFAANRLRVFSLLAEGGLGVEELAERTGAAARLLTGLLDACVAMGLLRLHDDRYINSHIAEAYLVEGRPRYLGDIIEVMSVEARNFEGLYDLVVSGTGTSGRTTERTIDDHRFTMAMNNLGMLGEAEALAAAVDLSGCKKMADIGCGSGVYSIALCRKYGDLHATLLDRDKVLETTRKLVGESDVRDRIRTVPSDITEDSYGECLDLVLLSDVLYQEESICRNILRSAYAALREGGTLLVRGYFADPEGSQPLFGSLFTLVQLLDDPNRQTISVPLLRRWVEQAGFGNVKTSALTERSSCLIAQR